MKVAERRGRAERATAETRVTVEVELDGAGQFAGGTGNGFFDHMLTALAKTAGWQLRVVAEGDLDVDAHHTVEDVGIVLGRALRTAIGDGAGLVRYGQALVPMDDALVEAACDVSGRSYVSAQLEVAARQFNGYHTELTPEFFWGLARGLGLTLHVVRRAGQNAHHITEAAYKALGVALRRALALQAGTADVPSTKGSLFA